MDEYSTELPRFPNSRLPSLAAAPGPVTRAWGTGCWIPLSMMLRVSIEEAADHPLILRVVLARFVLEELHAALAQGNRDLDAFLPKHQILGSRQEIGTFRSPKGSSVYLIFSLIDSLSFPPVTRAMDADDVPAVGEPDRENAGTHLPEAVIPLLAGT